MLKKLLVGSVLIAVLGIPSPAVAEPDDKAQQPFQTQMQNLKKLFPDSEQDRSKLAKLTEKQRFVGHTASVEASRKFYAEINKYYHLEPLWKMFNKYNLSEFEVYDQNKYENVVVEFEKGLRKEAVKLREEGRLDAAITASRTAFLQYLSDIDDIYRSDAPVYLVAMFDMIELRMINGAILVLEKEKFGEEFSEMSLNKAVQKVMPQLVQVVADNHEKGLNYDFNSRYNGSDPEIKSRVIDSMLIDEEDIFDRLDIPYFYAQQLSKAMTNAEISFLKNHFQAYRDAQQEVIKREIKLAKFDSFLGNTQQAITRCERILPSVQNVFGEQSEPWLDVMYILGKEYAAAGRYHESEKLLHGNNLVRVYIKLGKYSDAANLLNKILPTQANQQSYIYCNELLSRYIVREANDLSVHCREIPEVPNAKYDKIAMFVIDRIRAIENWHKKTAMFGVALINNLTLIPQLLLHFEDSHYLTIDAFCDLSDTYLKLNDANKALGMAERVLKKSRERYGDRQPSTIKAMHVLADGYREIGKCGEAKKLDEAALSLCKTVFGVNSLEELEAQARLAQDFVKEKNYGLAKKLYEETIDRFKNNYGTDNVAVWKLMVSLAEVYELNGEHEKANLLCREVFETRPDFLKLINTEAIKLTHTMAQSYQMTGNATEAIKEYESLIKIYEGIRHYDSMEGGQVSQWFANIVPVYKEMATAYVSAGKTGSELLKLTDLCKARNLTEKYNEQNAIYSGGISDADMKVINGHLNALKVYDEAIEAAEKSGEDDYYLDLVSSKTRRLFAYKDFLIGLENKYPKFKELRNFNLADQSDLQQKLQTIPEDACFIDFTVLRENNPDNLLLACIASPDGTVKAVPVSVDKDFFEHCHVYHETLSYPTIAAMQGDAKYLYKKPDGSYIIETDNESDPGELVTTTVELEQVRQELGARLSASLITPIKGMIPVSASRWIISPDGVLNNVPFETLQYEGKTLIESKDVSYVPSLSVMKMMQDLAAGRSKTPGRKDLFAMGGAEYGGHQETEQRDSMKNMARNARGSYQSGALRTISAGLLSELKWKNLPGTEKELKGVSSLFAKDKQIVFRGKNVSESNLKALDKKGELGQYKYLLFATHGLFVPDVPELSSIVLSQDATQKNKGYDNDGYVTVGEWMGYKLNSDLVYLSACESGRGAYRAGEGIVGIPYALTKAGNQNTVMSLWKVQDEPTAEFSKAFFEKLSRGVPQVKALSETKREFMKQAQYSNPSIWSAFLLYGL